MFFNFHRELQVVNMAKIVLVCFCLSVVSFASAKIKLDSLIPICSKSDPNLDECVKNSANAFIPYMVKGIRDFNVPPFDPLKIPYFIINQDPLKVNISDSSHEGLGATKISAAKVDLKHFKFHIDANFPRYSIVGNCDISGKLFLLPISGNGFCNLTTFDMGVSVDVIAKPSIKDGVQYMKATKILLNTQFSKGSAVMEGLFGGNKQLGDTMTRFINENTDEIFKEFKPTLEAVWGELFGGLINRLFDSVPLDELLKP